MFSSSCSLFVGVQLSLLAIVSANIFVCNQQQTVDDYVDVSSTFGPDLPPKGLRGVLVKAEPSNGCSAIANPPSVGNYTGKWLALINRQNCSFEMKVRNAQAAGYDCAVVHNVDSDELVAMSARNHTGILIPSVFVGSHTGLILEKEYLYTKGYQLKVDDLPKKDKAKVDLQAPLILTWPWYFNPYTRTNYCL
ncbi:unnamed protein product [Arctia plantaginis]|uniref:PA domain-containing protein n=1 Tax=Arctia plantaginis TaxID=874455 RepID=A0A8S1AJL0_ARCPL|nr:unnamed protein product [Arctia plantaginis]CAB3245458.1 unnamed protein product [Arctia plantaginis]